MEVGGASAVAWDWEGSVTVELYTCIGRLASAITRRTCNLGGPGVALNAGTYMHGTPSGQGTVLQTRRSGPAPPPRDGAADHWSVRTSSPAVGWCCGPSDGAARRPDFHADRETCSPFVG